MKYRNRWDDEPKYLESVARAALWMRCNDNVLEFLDSCNYAAFYMPEEPDFVHSLLYDCSQVVNLATIADSLQEE